MYSGVHCINIGINAINAVTMMRQKVASSLEMLPGVIISFPIIGVL